MGGGGVALVGGAFTFGGTFVVKPSGVPGDGERGSHPVKARSGNSSRSVSFMQGIQLEQGHTPARGTRQLYEHWSVQYDGI